MSDGLSAVYRFETRIKPKNQTTSWLYAGLSGGFGTVSLGRLQTADDVHVGFVDNSNFLGGEAGLIGFTSGSSVSYASPSIGGFSFQVDVQGDQGGAQDKDVDSAQFGATLQLGDNAKIGVAYVDRATMGKDTPIRAKDAEYNFAGSSQTITTGVDHDALRASLRSAYAVAVVANEEEGIEAADPGRHVATPPAGINDWLAAVNDGRDTSLDATTFANLIRSDDEELTNAELDALLGETGVWTTAEILAATTATNPNPAGKVTKTADAVPANDLAHLDDDRTAMIAAQYTIGGMALHLGYGERKWDTDSKAAEWKQEGTGDNPSPAGYEANGLIGEELLDKKQKTTFFGVGGGIGDTGVNFFLQVKDTKTTSNKVTHSYRDKLIAQGLDVGGGTLDADENTPARRTALTNAGINVLATGAYRGVGQTDNAVADDPDTDVNEATRATAYVNQTGAEGTAASAADRKRGSEKSSVKNTPFTIGLSRSLGGGASIHLEHDNTDDDASHNQTALILKVDF